MLLAMSHPAAQLTFRQVLAIPAVRRLWIAQLISVFGDFLAVFAVFSVVTFKLHGTPTQVGFILVSFLLPFAFIGPIAGVYVDKWNVKTTMVASDLIRGLLVLLLLVSRDLYTIYAVLFTLSAVSSFFVPAQAVALRTLTPHEGLMAANALLSQAAQLMMILSPALAGLLVQWIGADSCFLIDSVSFFFSAGLVLSLDIRRAPISAEHAARSVLHSLRQGVTFIFTHPIISFVVIAMTSGMFAMRSFGALLSVYVRDVLASTSTAFGVLNSLIGVGMICGSLLLPRLARTRGPQSLVLTGLCGMGVAVLLAAAFAVMLAVAVAMLTLGFFAAFVMIPATTLLQRETPQEMLGRVSSSLFSLLSFAQVLAMLGAGPFAQAAGIRSLYYASAAMLLAIAAIGFGILRSQRTA